MIFLDSWIFLEYFLRGEKANLAEKVIDNVIRKDRAVTSATALLEVKYRIAKKFGLERAEEAAVTIQNISNLSILPVTVDIAKLAATLRMKYYTPENQLSFIDTIHLATAVLTNCNRFLTGDKDFIAAEEIKVEII